MKEILKISLSLWLLIFTVVFLHSQIVAITTVTDRHIVQLEYGCILNIESKFDSSDVTILEIEDGLSTQIKSIQELIPADSLTINIRWPQGEDKKLIIPSMGIGGSAENGYVINLFIEPENTNFKFEHLYNVLAHESHHAIRARKLGDWETLLDLFVFDGLAPIFQMEACGSERPFYTTFLDEGETEKYIKMSEPYLLDKIDFEQENNLYIQWFFSQWINTDEEKKIPPMTGFSIGWQIIHNYIKEHPDATASNLIFVSAEEIASSTFDIEKLKELKSE